MLMKMSMNSPLNCNQLKVDRNSRVPEMVTPAMRTTAVLLGFLNLTNMPCSVHVQAAWQVILISLKSS